MTYRLQITHELPSPPIQGNNFLLLINIENIGENDYPGGKFNLFRVRYIGFGEATQTVEKIVDIPTIAIGASWTYRRSFFAISDGLSWIDIEIVDTQNSKVNLFQFKDGPSSQSWQMPFYVKNRDSAKIIELLETLIEKVSSLKEII